MSQNCIFCKIIQGHIPSTIIYEDAHVIAFNDIAPVAPVHVLVVPKKHISSAHEVSADDASIFGSIFAAAQQIAKEKGIADSGYRVVTNAGKDAGQVVFHLHFHVVGGKGLSRFA